MSAPADAVRSARRRLQRLHHPDRPTGNAEASRLINAAADILLEHRAAYEEWLCRKGVALQLLRASVVAPSPLFSLADEQSRATLAKLLDQCVDRETRMTHQQQLHSQTIRDLQRATSQAERRLRRANEAARDFRHQLAEATLQLGQQQEANDALQAQLAVVQGQLEEQTAVALAGQLAELRASEHAAAVRAARAEAAAEAAARAEAAAEAATARSEAAEMVAAARAEAAAEAATVRSEAAEMIATARAEAANARSEAAEMVAAARAEAAAARDGATGTAAEAAPPTLVRQCLEAIGESRINSAIRRKAVYLLDSFYK